MSTRRALDVPKHGNRASAMAAVLCALLLVAGCAERRDPVEAGIRPHPSAWSQPAAADFHGGWVEQNSDVACRGCHGGEIAGRRPAPTCYACHDGPSGHPYGWTEVASPSFHADVVAREGTPGCGSCHGQAFDGGWSGVACSLCHAGGASGHPDGWLDPRSASFHGRRVAADGFSDCRRCHGNDLLGGTSGLACAACHR